MKTQKKVLITGAGGFIGKNLAEYLEDKYQISTPSHKVLDLLNEADVKTFLVKNKIEIVIHCANAGGGRDTVGRKNVIYENLKMFFNLARNCHLFEKMISLGSGAEYDMRHYKHKMPEEYFDTFVPSDDYGFSKYICSKYIEKSNNIVNLRLFGVFGKYENPYLKFISNAIVKNIFKQPIKINQNAYFDYLYINDLVKINEILMNKKTKYKTYNVTTEKTIDLLTISKIINQQSAFKSTIKIIHRGLNQEYSAKNARLIQEIGQFQFTNIKTSVVDLFNWYQENIDKIDKKKIIEDPYLKFAKVKI